MKGHIFLLMLFLVLAILIASVFVFVYKSSLKVRDDGGGVKNPTQKRFFFFLLLGASLLILLSVTIPKSPYFIFANETPSTVIYATARQYLFAMSTRPIDETNLMGDSKIEFPAGQLVEFRVTAADVNHGFAIYNDQLELITQTQAMPGYVNRLRWKFDQPGNYHIICLEFCGAGHPFMRSFFTVK